MQSFILVGCLAVLASAASLSKDEFDRLESTYNLTAFVGPNYNLTVVFFDILWTNFDGGQRPKVVLRSKHDFEAVDILVEEARTVGVTTEQHLKTCIARMSNFFQLSSVNNQKRFYNGKHSVDREMSKFNHAWAEFKLKGASLHFESVDQVREIRNKHWAHILLQIMPVLKKETPKIHTALNEFRPVYKSMMTGVDENAAAFMEQV